MCFYEVAGTIQPRLGWPRLFYGEDDRDQMWGVKEEDASPQLWRRRMTICPNYATKKWHRGRARCLQANLTCTSHLQADCQMQGKGTIGANSHRVKP